MNAWINQLYGEKRFTLFPGRQEELVYPKADDPWHSDVNIFNPDYAKFPKYKDATPMEFTVGAGETLFISFGTWHTAHSLTATISVAFDQLNRKNYPDFMKDVWRFGKRQNRQKAIARYGYAWLAGQSCKLGEVFK
ncbi:MAG TPA: cupin-like domain-containing protein [Flavitalea sp.]|nr:cupin-like domain-containing protein [Flavitalea sp.]